MQYAGLNGSRLIQVCIVQNSIPSIYTQWVVLEDQGE